MKRSIVAILAAALCASAFAGGAVVINPYRYAAAGGGGNPPTFVRAVAATAQSAADSISVTGMQSDGTNRVMYAAITSWKASGAYGVTAVSFNTTESFTKVGEIIWETQGKTEIWCLIAPSVTTAGVGATLTTGTGSSAMVVWLVNGANQTTPTGTPATNTTTGTSVSASATSTTNSLVFAALGFWKSQTYTEGGSQTVPTNGTSIATDSESVIVSYKAGADTSTSMSWSWGTATDAGIYAFAVNPP